MTLALGTLLVLLTCNGLGWVASYWLDRYGPPAAWSVQTVRRKPGQLRARLPLILLNFSLIAGPAFPVFWWLEPSFSFEVPSVALLVGTIAAFVVVDDTWFYLVHRLIHENKWLYRHIHKLHHEAYAPVPIEYLYAHPVEWMVGSLGPSVMVGVLAVTGYANAWAFWAWLVWRIGHELDIHSGIGGRFGPVIPLFASTVRHDVHHARPNAGNYGSSFTWWDRLFGTEAR